MDKEVIYSTDTYLYRLLHGTDTFCPEGIMKGGAILLCKAGSADISVNYTTFDLGRGSVMTLFPDDLVSTVRESDDFCMEVLTFSPSILREASLDMEQTVYSALREDRCRGGAELVTGIITSMFTLLEAYYMQPECMCLNRLVICQLKAFFIGFHDYLIRFPDKTSSTGTSKHKRSIFDRFMHSVEHDYKKSRNVQYYASLLNITPKYLNIISKSITGHNAKAIIDHYVVLKLKLELSDQDKSMKQILCEYNFNDPSFFSRYFKTHTGLTPLSYRKANYTLSR